MPRILVIPSWYPKGDSLSGIFIQEQLIELSKKGIDVTTYFLETTANKPNNALLKNKLQYQEENGVKVYRASAFLPPKRIPLFERLWHRRVRKDIEKIMNEKGQFDLIHAHGFVSGFIAEKLSKGLSIPYIITEHNSTIVTGRVLYPIEKLRKTYEESRMVIAVSDLLSNHIKEIAPNSTIKTIPNGVNSTLFNLSSEKTDDFNFVALGALIPRKNHELIIRSFHQLLESSKFDNVYLNIIGYGSESEKLKSTVKELRLDDKISFYERIPRDEVGQIVANSNCLVSASKAETFGISIVEGMACGLPVIATDTGIASELINFNNGLLINSNDQKQLYEAMDFILKNQNLYDPAKIREDVLSKYGNDQAIKEVAKIYSLNDVLVKERSHD